MASLHASLDKFSEFALTDENRRLHSLNFSAWNFRSAHWTALETMDESFP
jgi:hypothetical protein